MVFSFAFLFFSWALLGSGSDPSPVEILERQLAQVRGKDAVAEITLLTSIGNFEKEGGRYSDAISHFESARSLAARLGDTERLISSLQGLGSAKLRKGQFKSARSDLEMAKELLPVADQHAVLVVQELANVRREMGHFDAALDLYDEAQTHVSNDGEDETVAVQVDRAETLANKGQFQKAQDLLQQTLAKMQKKSVRMGSAFSVLGAVHHAKGDLEHAGEMYNKSLKLQFPQLRATHPDIVMTQLRMSRLQRDSGDLTGAMQTLAAVEESLWHAESSPLLTNALIVKADLLREERRHDEAVHAINTALEVHERCCLNEDTPDLGVAVHTYGSILHDQGDFDAALDKYKHALSINLQTVGLNHPETAATHNSLGTLHQDTGNDADAEVHFAQCLEIQLVTVGRESPEISNTFNNLATILFRKGAMLEARQFLEQALQILDDAGVPETNPDRNVYQQNLSEVLAALDVSSVTVV